MLNRAADRLVDILVTIVSRLRPEMSRAISEHLSAANMRGVIDSLLGPLRPG